MLRSTARFFLRGIFPGLILGLSCSLRLFAGPATEPVSLGTLLQEAATTNPDLQAAWAEHQAKRNMVPVASSLEDPRVTWTRFLEGVQTRTGVQQHVFAINQMIPFPGKLSAKGHAASLMADKARLAYDMKVRETVARIKKMYADLWFFTNATRIAETNRHAVDLVAGLGVRDQGNTQSVLQEVLRAQQQQAQVQYDVLTYGELAAARKAQLNALLGRPPATPLVPADLSVPDPTEGEAGRWSQDGPVSTRRGALPTDPAEEKDLDRWTELAMAHQEELKALELDVRLARSETRLARLGRLPDLMLGYNLIKIGGRPDLPAGRMPGEGIDARGVTFSLNIPIWEGRNRARIRAAKATEEARRRQLEDRRNHVRADLKEMWLLLRNSRRLLELYENNLVPQARLALSTAETDTREDRRSMADFLEAQSVLYAFQLAALKARVDLFQAWVDIERTIGRMPVPEPEKEKEATP